MPMSSSSVGYVQQPRLGRSLLLVKGITFLKWLLVGGFITLMELTNRATLVGGFPLMDCGICFC